MEAQFRFRRLQLAVILIVALTQFPILTRSDSVAPLQIVNAERRIDLTSHIVKVFLTLQVENIRESPASEVILIFPPAQVANLALLKAQVATGKRKKSHLPIDVNPVEVPDTPDGTRLFSLSLLKPLNSGEKVTLEVLYILTHSLKPFPVEIKQSESQLVYFHDSAVLLSPYPVNKQTTFIKTPTSKIESFTVVDPANRAGAEIKYGPYDSRPPYSFSPVVIHLENNNPFAVVEELVREIEISHWGSLQITEHYTLSHDGARHKGGFSRFHWRTNAQYELPQFIYPPEVKTQLALDGRWCDIFHPSFDRVEYQSRQAFTGSYSIKSLLARLPPRVHSVYYRDQIGNISSSRLRTSSQKSELELEPRYPLFGGWKATFIIGYGLPLEDFLFESPDGRRYLNFTFGCPFADTVVDKLIIKVILPEGSQYPSAVTPFHVEERREKSYSYLDVVGRNVVVLEKKNVVPEMNSAFQVYYKFNPLFQLAEPLMLVIVFFLGFMACVTYLKTDISLRKQE